jgi:Zn-dependent protease
MKFTKKEIKELLKAWFFISLAFAILFAGLENLLRGFILSGLTVGLAFLFHEIMHKALAIKYGLEAEFRAFDKMLWLALLFSFFGFIIAAPGAVMIKGRLSKEKNGKISLAGPMTNISLAGVFLILLISLNPEGIFSLFLDFGFRINSLLALFNILPIPGFDGSKVLKWNKLVYILTAGLAGGLLLISYIL